MHPRLSRKNAAVEGKKGHFPPSSSFISLMIIRTHAWGYVLLSRRHAMSVTVPVWAKNVTMRGALMRERVISGGYW